MLINKNMKYTHEDGTPFTKEEFLQKLKTDKEFNNEFGNKGIDQIAILIHELKTNPDSRRLLVSAWAVHDLPNMTLPPCHYGFQVYTRELSLEERKKYGIDILGYESLLDYGHSQNDDDTILELLNEWNVPKRAISLMWNQRSCDFPLGIPYNIASYAILLEIIGKMVNMVPDELIGNLGDCHIYLNQIEGCKEQIGRELDKIERINYGVNVLGYESLLDYGHSQNEDELIINLCDEWGVPKRTREPYPLPNLVFSKTDEFFKELGNDLSLVTNLDNTDFKVENYQSHPTIKFPLSN